MENRDAAHACECASVRQHVSAVVLVSSAMCWLTVLAERVDQNYQRSSRACTRRRLGDLPQTRFFDTALRYDARRSQ